MKRCALAVALLAAVPLVHASELSYSYLEAGYFNVDPEGFSSEDGWSFGGSAALSDNFHLFGSHDNLDIGPFDVDLWRIGLGYNMSISDRSDLVARIAYEDFDADDGWSAEVGLRGALSPKFEGYVALGYVDGSTLSGDPYLKLQGQYKFNRTWGITAETRVFEDAHTFFIGPRVSF